LVALQLSRVTPVAPIATVWLAGGTAPNGQENVRLLGVEVRVPPTTVTVRVTGTVTGEFVIPLVVDAIEILSLYVPAVNPLQLTDTVRVEATVLLVGDRPSQACPLVALQLSRVVLIAPIATVWLAGLPAPATQV
jgi:hypothetical protein